MHSIRDRPPRGCIALNYEYHALIKPSRIIALLMHKLGLLLVGFLGSGQKDIPFKLGEHVRLYSDRAHL